MKKKQQTLRTRPAPEAVAELLVIANKLPRTPSHKEIQRAHHDFSNINKPTRPLNDWIAHDNVVDAPQYGYNEKWVSLYLEDALTRLPPELQAFVTQDLEFKRGEDGEFYFPPLDKRWRKEGPHLFDYAVMVHSSSRLNRIESMRQRYIFLFAVRDILFSVAQPDLFDSYIEDTWEPTDTPPVLSDPQRWLEAVQQSLRNPLRLLNKVDGLHSQLNISPEKNRVGTHELSVSKPLFFRVLEGVEIERIRKCPICEKLFWAGRLDQSACSSRCSNVRRGRVWRKKYYEKYKERRQQARTSKTSHKTTNNGGK